MSATDSTGETDSGSGSDGGVAAVPRRIRNRLVLDHLARVKELEKHMLHQMTKGPKCQRDDAKSVFEAQLSALQARHAEDLQAAVAAAAAQSHEVVEHSLRLPDEEQLASRSVRVAVEKREKLSRKRADYLSRRIYKELRLRATARDPDFSSVVKMIQNSPANLEHCVESGQTLLLAAADLGAHAVIACLLEAGAKADAMDEQQRCALVIAASHNHSANVDILLDHMSSSTGASRRDITWCMQHAILFGSTHVARSLLQHIRSKGWFMEFLEWSLIAAATAADVDIMQLLLQHGASPNAADSLKRSALSHSIASKVRQPVCAALKKVAQLMPLAGCER